MNTYEYAINKINRLTQDAQREDNKYIRNSMLAVIDLIQETIDNMTIAECELDVCQ